MAKRKPVAVSLGRRQYARLTSSYRRFSEAYGEFTENVNLAELAIDPDEVFAGVRDATRGFKKPRVGVS